jgi:CRISPR/Cas system-associated protein Cas7 (RAMP superfamily)
MSHVDVQSGQKSKVKNVKNQELLRIENKNALYVQTLFANAKPTKVHCCLKKPLT